MRFFIISVLIGCALISASFTMAQSRSNLRLLPAQVTLTGSQATQRLLVEAQRDGQFIGDRTAEAVFTSSNPKIAEVGKDGMIRAIGNGTTTITAIEHGEKTSILIKVVGANLPSAWNFRNHVLPILTKSGCNAGACHGAAAGKGGLKLTLRGYDPDADFAVLTRQAMARRVVSGDPAHSLLLLKTTMTIPHGGGKRIEPASLDYRVLSSWIKAGTPRPQENDPRLLSLEVSPPLARLKPGDMQQILVRGRYSDNHSEDVTRWVKFGTSDNSVAGVDDFGRVKMNGRGEAAITVWFSSKVTFARVIAPFSNTIQPEVYASAKRSNFIDDLVLRKLQLLNIMYSKPCTDNEFIRRVYLDTAGILPTSKETNDFHADKSSDRRVKLIDTLLKRPEFTDYWAYKWSDLFLLSSRKIAAPGLTAFSQYIRKSVADNKPWNTFAREIMTATGSNLDNGAVNYWVMHKDPVDLTETTTQAFMSMSLMCARCHNHPLEKWTQRDYYQMANLFSRVSLKNGDKAGEVLALVSTEGNINHPRLGVPLPPRPLDGIETSLEDTHDRRQKIADWLTSPDNPYFAKALVNRVWKNFMGRGLVEAEDDLRLTNPPSNQELLDALAKDFIQNGYDVKKLIRMILMSETYQRSAEPADKGLKDERYYSHYIVRRLPAEVILDALSSVTAIPTEFANNPKGTRALQLADSQVASYFLTSFGRPERERTCACERQQEPNVAQALHLSNGDTINMKLRATGGFIDQLLSQNLSQEQSLNAVYLAALSRLPTESEKRKTLQLLVTKSVNPLDSTISTKNPESRALMEDLLWAVMTDKEFLFNH